MADREKLERLRRHKRPNKSFSTMGAVGAHAGGELAAIDGIERALNDMHAGRTVPHGEAMARLNKLIEVAQELSGR